jgi:hypothetical protein
MMMASMLVSQGQRIVDEISHQEAVTRKRQELSEWNYEPFA